MIAAFALGYDHGTHHIQECRCACAQYLLGRSFRISAESGLTFLRQEKEVIEEASSCGLVSFADHLLAVERV